VFSLLLIHHFISRSCLSAVKLRIWPNIPLCNIHNTWILSAIFGFWK
jgi:hypothetical protein